ncbi:hypothetical protein BDD43_5067 [Mucilaginibacter gracilis]|uniref:Uncharacterized protein n=1 Tax=Mucilaginibacter gracilis TaxID=423350 RepID=A0A495J8U5_9SPHI|nr:hypothetical protein [Mucilaginibacter gracilis]RKR84814.1 hypothetical protein BDD43_5067 [Mucilaginibacter gracilis]
MLNEADFFWKNWRLGTELQIAGTFLYNGLYAFDQMESFYHEAEVFEFLYNISVGLERLAKITVILLEHDIQTDQEDFEKKLITHDHFNLLNRIKAHKEITMGKSSTKFLQVIKDFYHSSRYNRYNKKSVYAENHEAKFRRFLEEELDIKVKVEMIETTPNDQRIKNFIGKIISKITLQLYEIIRNECRRMNIYTYEVNYESKAFKIFIRKEFSFKDEHYLKKEILIHLLRKRKKGDGFQDFVKTIKPLPFETYNTNYYVQYLMNFHKHPIVLDELRSIAEDKPLKKERLEKVSLLGEDVEFDKFNDSFFDDFL